MEGLVVERRVKLLRMGGIRMRIGRKFDLCMRGLGVNIACMIVKKICTNVLGPLMLHKPYMNPGISAVDLPFINETFDPLVAADTVLHKTRAVYARTAVKSFRVQVSRTTQPGLRTSHPASISGISGICILEALHMELNM